MDIQIISPTTYEATHYEAVCRLLSQLTTRDITLTPDAYCRLITSPCCHLLLLQSEEGIAGMLTVGMYHSPTGSKAWIEDVVVDTAFRGKGLGRMMMTHAIDYCRKMNINTVYLTSNPRRIAANALYQSLGFDRKETNMYRLELKR